MSEEQYKVEIDYTNWRGERRKRVISPISISFGLSEYHPGPQWILLAMCWDAVAAREFAMKDIHSWQPVTQRG